MASTKFSWEQDWILTYDLDHADGISKDDIVDASNGVFKKSVRSNQSTVSYDMPSTTLWAERNKFQNTDAVRDAFYKAFNSVKGSNSVRVKKLVICDYVNDKLYIENN